jgi:hypothetical protein
MNSVSSGRKSFQDLDVEVGRVLEIIVLETRKV